MDTLRVKRSAVDEDKSFVLIEWLIVVDVILLFERFDDDDDDDDDVIELKMIMAELLDDIRVVFIVFTFDVLTGSGIFVVWCKRIELCWIAAELNVVCVTSSVVLLVDCFRFK